MNLQLLRPMAEKGRSLQDGESHEEEVKAILQNGVESGRIGALKVDPQYWVVDSGSGQLLENDSFPCVFTDDVLVTTNVISDSSSTANAFFDLSGTKLYIVLGCLAALILLALVQASCTIYRSSKKPVLSHKVSTK